MGCGGPAIADYALLRDTLTDETDSDTGAVLPLFSLPSSRACRMRMPIADLYCVMPCTHLGSSTTPPSTRALRTGARGRTVAVGV